MKKAEQALHDLQTIARCNVKVAARLATTAGVSKAEIEAAVRDRDAGGLAHLMVRKCYGDRTYCAARKLLFNQ